jgi:histidyl-tRNA synthetase
VPLAKYVSMHYGELSFPFRRYQIGKVYRGERPQKGRFREFYQCDIDIIGDNELNIMHDAEMPMVIYNTFKKLGFDDFTIRINNRKILNGFFASLAIENPAEVLRIVDKLDKIGIDEVRNCLAEINIKADSINKIIEFISITGSSDEKITHLKALNIDNELFTKGIEELETVINGIRLFGIPENNFKVDLTIARGLDYYTGTVYETFLNDYRELGSVCSGGRYDNLAEFYTDKKLPGVGISIGLTRLFYKLNELNAVKVSRDSIAKVLVVSASSDISPCLPIATAFRTVGINTELFLTDKKIKAKFKYADKLNIPFVVVIGEDEVTNNTVSLKNMKTGEQFQVSIQEAIEIINKF